MANAWWQTPSPDQQQDPSQWWQQPSFFGGLADDTSQPSDNQGFFGKLTHAAEDIGHDVGGVAHGVGSFFGGIGKSIYNDAKTTVSTVGDIAQAVHGAITDPGKIKANEDAFHTATHQYQNGDITLDELNQKYKEFQQTAQNIGTEVKNRGINNDNGLKSGAAAANTFLNLATLGIGGGVKALVQGGAEDIAKEAAENGGKAALKKAGTVIFSNGKDEAEREALHEAVTQGGNTAAKATVNHVGEQIATQSALGAGQGAAGAAEQPDANLSDVWQGALRGGAFGAAFGGATPLLNKDIRTGLAAVPGAARDAVGNLRDSLGNLTPLGESGHVQNPFYKGPADEADAQMGGGSNLTPEDEQKAALYQDVAQHFSNPKDYVDQAAKTAWNYDKGQKGGQMQQSSYDYGTPEYIRTSTHSQFYSDYYAEHGKAPSQAAFRDKVQEALEGGTSGDGIVDPEESHIYQILKDKEGGDQALAQSPEALHNVTQQKYADALNGSDVEPGDAATPTANTPVTPAPAVTEPTDAPAETPTPTATPQNRGFFESVKEADTTSPELKKAIGEVDPQKYTPDSNQALVDNAKKIVDDDPIGAHSKILTTDNPSDQDVVTGIELMRRAQSEGRTSDAVAIADKLDQGLRAHGKAVQAASVLQRLSPEGVLRYAAKKFHEGRETVSAGRRFERGTGNEQKVTKAIKQEVEDAGKPDAESVTKAIRRTVKETDEARATAPKAEGEEEELSTGQKVAKRVENTVKPKIKKKADELVNELTKKVKQEMMEPKVEGVKKDPLDTLRAVFKRDDEAKEAFPEAQRILREKFKNNPKALEKLDKFFTSELDMPAAHSTIDAAVRDHLVKSETKIRDIITKSYSGQAQSIQDIADALTKEGFDETSAKTIAKEVTSRVDAQIKDAKSRVLTRIANESSKKSRPTFLDKLNKFSNLGALSDADYLTLARAKLDLPQLTPEIAKDLFTMTQKLQDMEPGAEKNMLAKKIYARVQDAIPKSKKQQAAELLSAPKAIMASSDLSGTLRQGGVLGARFRTEAADAFKKQVKYFRSSDEFEKGMAAIQADPLYDTALKANLALTGTDGAEEAFVSQLPEKIPVFGKLVGASDRGYTGGLTELRFNAFKHIANDLKNSGIDIATLGDKELESIGKFINTASGRGYGAKDGLFEKIAPALNRTLFSPRLWKSRLDMLNPMYYAKLDPIARKYALQSAGDFAGIAGVVLGLATLAGAQVGTDPRSSDFLKIKVGDTRYDILGGFQQNLTFAWRELSGQTKSSTTGDVSSLGSGGFGKANRLSILGDLVSNKENPVISTGSDLLSGTNSVGQKVDPKTELAQLFIPLNFQDTYSLNKSSNPLEAFFGATIPGTLGVGVNTYSDPKADPFKAFSDSLAGQ